MLSYDELLAQGYVTELARLYRDDSSAQHLLREAGFPREEIPPLAKAPSQYWRDVLTAAYDGLLGDPTAIIWKALERYKHNDVFLQIKAKAAPPVVRVLYVAANPLDKAQLYQQGEFKAIRKCLEKAPDRVHLDSSWATRWADLLPVITAYKPTIVHVSVHGRFDGLLFFDDGKGVADPVDPRAFAAVFAAANRPTPVTRVVLFSACHSRATADLVREVVEVVVGTTGAINDEAAGAFSTAFYEALVAQLVGGADVAAAARAAITAGKDGVRALNRPEPPYNPDTIVAE